MQIGTLTALALVLSGCNLSSDDDDDCALGPTGGGGTVVLAMQVPATVDTPASTADRPAPAGGTVPDRGGFGTYLADCGSSGG
ncbi:hypothetical protein E1091_18580 [Micromonospora fluostatini]|uniref:Lipoprotein n=1 Tax=Micromonospora fluostatini TaxID=1629071 RepID=A0ABY2DCA5_9ACTN|nr:hypothetical protein E1091_18580 [Micromonospora fluostatini]